MGRPSKQTRANRKRVRNDTGNRIVSGTKEDEVEQAPQEDWQLWEADFKILFETIKNNPFAEELKPLDDGSIRKRIRRGYHSKVSNTTMSRKKKPVKNVQSSNTLESKNVQSNTLERYGFYSNRNDSLVEQKEKLAHTKQD